MCSFVCVCVCVTVARVSSHMLGQGQVPLSASVGATPERHGPVQRTRRQTLAGPVSVAAPSQVCWNKLAHVRLPVFTETPLVCHLRLTGGGNKRRKLHNSVCVCAAFEQSFVASVNLARKDQGSLAQKKKKCIEKREKWENKRIEEDEGNRQTQRPAGIC